MPHRLTAACTLALLSAMLLRADNIAEQSRLLALENAWNLAQIHRDDKALRSLISDEYVYTDYDGTVMTKAQFLADLKDPEYKATLVTNENMKVFAYQNAAIVIGTYHSKGTYKRQPFDHWGRFTDSWIFNNGKWQCVATHTNLIKK
ncbi:MAG: hypothetical protein DMG90_04165 [Acidobacteria bacterium]|jgi:hypothetical protein|nr:MAG: hypothetical protein DMG91_16520 [Acidobacteriota bacterium]PYV92632.1 MAG: hypothetical protein DMG90_04165 [Acidobacteriota bacterium]